MGRHASPTGSSRRVGVVAVITIAVLGAGAGGIWAATRGGDSPAAAADATRATPSTTSTSGDSSVKDADPSPSEQALTACRSTISAGEAVASAAAASARDWEMHTGAQVKLDSGEYTVVQTRTAWAQSKARAAADLTGYAAADKVWSAARGGCKGIKTAAVGADAAAGQSCAARAAALADVASTGAAVNQQWATHVDMMANKEGFGPAAYHHRWVSMVTGARAPLTAYTAAAAALKDAPAC